MSGDAKNDLMALLNLLKSKAESSNLEPKIGMHRILELMRGQGYSFNYAIFTQLAQDPVISNFITDYNKDQVTLNTEGSEIEQPEKLDAVPDEAEEVEQQRDVVGDMAKRALSRRQ